MRRMISTALLALVAASPALAQERAPFTGARVEGLAGWDRLKSNGRDDSIVYGIGAGYDMQMGSAVVGIEGEINDSNIKECVGSKTQADPRLCTKAARDLYVGGRVGTVVGASTLLYAKAGYTNARAKFTADDGIERITLARRDLDGVRVGVGAEHALSNNAFVKTEYRYSNYERGVERHQVLGGVGFRF